MAGKPTSKRDIDRRKLAEERDEIPFNADNPKHTGIHADTSKLTDDEVNENPLYWRERLRRSRGVVFDDAAKTAWLEAFRQSGKITVACRETGVHRQTVLRHREKDEEFEAAFDLMLELHAEAVVHRLESDALDGFHNDVFNAKTGDVIGSKLTYETPLRVAMLKRFDPNYKDRSEVDINHSGKVIAAPPRVGSIEEFQKIAEKLRADHAAIQKQREEQDAADAQGHVKS